MNIVFSPGEIETLADAATAWVLAFMPHLIGAVAVLVLGLVITRWLSVGLSRMLSRSGRIDMTIRPVLVAAVRYGAIIFVVVIALNQLGVQTTSLFAILGAAGLAIGLALQGTLSNIASGLMLLWLRPFNVGDYIEVANQGIAGTIREIGLFACRIEGADGVIVFAPNATIWNFSIRNYRALDHRLIAAQIALPADTDPLAAIGQIKRMLGAAPFTLKDPAPEAFVETATADEIVVTATFRVRPGDLGDALRSLHGTIHGGFETGELTLTGPFRLNRLIPPPASTAAFQDTLVI